jgi:catechol 2,3-dioxygenase-like lactoylglutathione lyase family enzyme
MSFTQRLCSLAAAAAFFSGVALPQSPASPNPDVPPAFSGMTPMHITLSVASIDVERNWYEKALGFKQSRTVNENPNQTLIRVVIPGFGIDLIQAKGSTRSTPRTPSNLQQGYVHMAFTVADINAALAALKAINADVTPGQPDAKGAIDMLLVRDPEGNELELFSRSSIWIGN